MGGQNVRANANLSLVACSESIRLAISMPNETSPSYGIGSWVQETMGSPRVMPDSVLLPNGVIVVLNGAMQGLAGDSASGGGSKANYPNFYAEMYQPYAPVGQRWSTLSRSQIPRLYHSTTALTTNGTILVTGCDRCGQFVTNMTFDRSPAKADYRMEIFYPPFWYNFSAKPKILSAPSEVQYGAQFTVKYTGLQDPNVQVIQLLACGHLVRVLTFFAGLPQQVTSAVLVAPSSTTHSFNCNQRVVKLLMTSNPYTKTLTLTVRA